MKKNKFVSIILGVLMLTTPLCGCNVNIGTAIDNKTTENQETLSETELSKTYAVIRDMDFGAAYLDTSIENFEADGFKIGDSVNIIYSNGEELKDIPFYNGYYVKTNEPVVVAYPGYKYIAVAYSSGDSMWEKMKLTTDDTATVVLNEAGKYINTQNALSTVYSDNRDDYASDIVFANFRSLSGGTLKENTFYRGASPIDNEHNRAGTVDALIRAAGIKYDFNLSDSREEVEEFLAANPEGKGYLFTELMNEEKVNLLNLSAAYRSDFYIKSITSGFEDMMMYEGPYYIHCVEGKDRTGFACILLEALCNATYEEIEKDYMTTYENYYGITKDGDVDKYNAFIDLRLNDMLGYLAGTDDAEILKNTDFSICAREYLKNGGMSEEKIDEFIAFLQSSND